LLIRQSCKRCVVQFSKIFPKDNGFVLNVVILGNAKELAYLIDAPNVLQNSLHIRKITLYLSFVQGAWTFPGL